MADNLYLKAGITFDEKFDNITTGDPFISEINGRDSEDRGFEISTEFTKNIADNWEFGVGLSYQDHDKPEEKEYDYFKFNIPDFESVPVYMTVKYNVPVEWKVKPFLKVDLGYSFNDCGNGSGTTLSSPMRMSNGSGQTVPMNYEAKDGIYYGIGGGLEFQNAFISLMYKVNTGDVEISSSNQIDNFSHKQNTDFERLVLEFGYRFNF